MFKQLKFVIASTPRSGTHYIAAVLNKVGVLTTHELLCKYCHCWWTVEEAPILGEVSWLLAPRLDAKPDNIVLFHQTRHPVPTINSIIRTKHMEPLRSQNTEWLFSGATKKLKLVWPRLLSNDIEPIKARAIYFWIEWHKAILEQSKPSILIDNYYRYQVEKLGGEMLRKMLLMGDIRCGYLNSQLREFINSVPKNYYNYGKARHFITWDDLTQEAKDLAESFGYDRNYV